MTEKTLHEKTAELKASLASAQTLVERECRYPKVTLATIAAKIESETYLYHEHLTICILRMKNGFFVLGKAAPADPRNYNKTVGETFAREDAVKQIWQLEGYLLCEMSLNGYNDAAGGMPFRSDGRA